MKNLDPNLILAIVGTLAAYLYNRLHHVKQPSIEEIAKGVAIEQVALILADPARAAGVQQRISDAIYAALAKAGIKRSSLIDLAVTAATTRAMGELAKATLAAQVGKLADAAGGVIDTIAAAEARGKAKGVVLGEVEVVQ